VINGIDWGVCRYSKSIDPTVIGVDPNIYVGIDPKKFPYDESQYEKAVNLYAKCAEEYKNLETYQYDLVSLTQQAMVNRLDLIFYEIDEAIKGGNLTQFDSLVAKFLSIYPDLDKLLSSHKLYMLGYWLESAKNAAPTPREKALFEYDARQIITSWGGQEEVATDMWIMDYCHRYWSGMMNDYYVPKWSFFFNYSRAIIKGEKVKKPTPQQYYDYIKTFNAQTKVYPSEPVEDPVMISLEMIEKYGIGR
jgi:alpha-N-acetylglucosaminidase